MKYYLILAILVLLAACNYTEEQPAYESEPPDDVLPEIVLEFMECTEKCRYSLRHDLRQKAPVRWLTFYKHNERTCTEACKLVHSCQITEPTNEY